MDRRYVGRNPHLDAFGSTVCTLFNPHKNEQTNNIKSDHSMCQNSVQYINSSDSENELIAGVSTTKQQKYLDTFKSFAEGASHLALAITGRATKAGYAGVASSLVIFAIVYSWSNGNIPVAVVIGIVSGTPSALLLFLNSRLKDVIALPEKIEDLKTSISHAFERIEGSNAFDEIGNWRWQKGVSVFRQLREFVRIFGALRNVESSLRDVGHPEVILSVLAVANPGFGFILIAALLLNGFSIALTCLASMAWVIG